MTEGAAKMAEAGPERARTPVRLVVEAPTVRGPVNLARLRTPDPQSILV